MDNSSEEDVENVDNETDDVVTDCLRNSVVVRKILEHFSSPELRQLSFVNKLWKCEARSVMRKRGHFTAYVKSHDFDRNHPHKEVDAFVSDLKQMNPVPFSGMSIDINFYPWLRLFPTEAMMDHLGGVVLDEPSLKTVLVEWHGWWWKCMNSPAFHLTKKVLQDCCAGIEELDLWINDGRQGFIEKVVRDVTFPRLQTLKLRESSDGFNEAGQEIYMKALLSRAPNLKVLHSSWSINLMLKVLEGSSVEPVYTNQVVAPFDEISEDVMSAIGLAKMKLEYTGPEFDLEKFNRITPKLLKSSCATTICCIWLDAVLAVPLMGYGICLKNVKHLDMDIHFYHLDRLDPRILEIVKNFDYTRIFPNLKKVNIIKSNHFSSQSSPDHINAVIEQANAVLREPMPDRAANVKTLVLYQSHLSELAAQFFAQMFPSIENLEFRTIGFVGIGVPFESIWINWPNLKQLKVRGNMLQPAGNMDSVFCGIFPEEVAELKLKDDEYLKSVNIVPVMPAITCLKNLRILSLNHEQPRYVCLGDDGTFLFSKVTALIAFARQPALAVSLHISASKVPPAMDHLEPYVSISAGPR